MSSNAAILVSVIIPSYNYERSLPLCIQSLLDQTYTNLEIIVVDDWSTDNSLSVAKQFPVTVLQTPANGGPAVARNLGAAKAKGDVFFFLDADVELNLDAIEVAMDVLEHEQDVVSVCGVYDPKPLFIDSIWEEYKSLQAHVWRVSSIGRIATLSIAMAAVRRDAFERVGTFNADLRQTEGIDYGERLSRVGKIVLTESMGARHDDDYKLRPMLWKLWRRSQDRVPFYFKKGDLAKTFELPRRLASTALIGLFWMFCSSLLFTNMLWPGIFVTLAGSIWLERDMYLGAAKHLCPTKWPMFFVWYLAFHTAAGIGVLCGLIKFAFFPSFRKMYGVWDVASSTSFRPRT